MLRRTPPSLESVPTRLPLAWIAVAALAGGAAPPDLPRSGGLLAVNGTELWVARTGSGEPIVVVHGGPGLDHGYLLPHLEPLAADYELILFDQRLSGRSAPEVEEGGVTLAAFVEDIETLRSELGLGRIHLMAHSFGGLLAMRYAMVYGEELRSLVLLDSMAASSELWRREQQAVGGRLTEGMQAERRAVVESEGFAERRPEAIESLLRVTFSAQLHDPGQIDRLRLYVPDDYSKRSRRLGALGPEIESFDLHEALGAVTVPTLILYGASEPGAEIGGPRLHAALPNSQLVRIPGAGHFPFLEQPRAFLEAVRGFLRSLGTSPR